LLKTDCITFGPKEVHPKQGAIWLPVSLLQQSNILIRRCPTQTAHPCQLRHIQLLILKGGIVSQEHSGNIVCGCLRSADLYAFGLCICHSALYSVSDDTQFQFGKCILKLPPLARWEFLHSVKNLQFLTTFSFMIK